MNDPKKAEVRAVTSVTETRLDKRRNKIRRREEAAKIKREKKKVGARKNLSSYISYPM